MRSRPNPDASYGREPRKGQGCGFRPCLSLSPLRGWRPDGNPPRPFLPLVVLYPSRPDERQDEKSLNRKTMPCMSS
jgi:hypothetical protein